MLGISSGIVGKPTRFIGKRLSDIIFARMGHKKLIRFAEIKSFPNVMEYPEGRAGTWRNYFKNHNPITLELACGKGEYATGLAALHPDKNFIGIDVKGNRIWVGAKKALERNLKNVAFVRTQIDKLKDLFAGNEISEIWITFPDPFLRVSKLKKRLTHPKFLRLYQSVLIPGGKIHLKTDSPDLYFFTKKVIELYSLRVNDDLERLYDHENISPDLKIKTHYEGRNISKSDNVYYLCFSLPAEIPNKDEELKKFFKEKMAEGTHG